MIYIIYKIIYTKESGEHTMLLLRVELKTSRLLSRCSNQLSYKSHLRIRTDQSQNRKQTNIPVNLNIWNLCSCWELNSRPLAYETSALTNWATRAKYDDVKKVR